MWRNRGKVGALILGVLITVFFGTANYADDYIVLDGLGGIRAHWLQAEVTRLRCEGHCVDYRPWWRWRSATRAVNGPVNVIGYSLGGSRAVRAAHQLQVNNLELIDPVLVIGDINLPSGVPTTVYRATQPSYINSSPVYGCYLEIPFPTNHIGMPQYLRR